jgi:hypothetical protein
MKHAAKNGLVYHLWWHPHNFGIHQEQNLHVLKNVLDYFGQLAQEYGMVSRSMGELVLQGDRAGHAEASRWSHRREFGLGERSERVDDRTRLQM